MSGDHGGASAALAAKVRRVEALLEQRGLVDASELDRALTAFLAKGSPASGARAVARAWLDEGFRERLLSRANAALPEIGLSMGGGLQEQRLKVVENTPSQHNVIVCTLCSCYPISLLGPSPTWYKSEGYRSRVVREPRAVLHEFGYDVPDDVEITVGRKRGVASHGPSAPSGRDAGVVRGGARRARHPQRPHRSGAYLSARSAATPDLGRLAARCPRPCRGASPSRSGPTPTTSAVHPRGGQKPVAGRVHWAATVTAAEYAGHIERGPAG
jgi:nitrile hydratase